MTATYFTVTELRDPDGELVVIARSLSVLTSRSVG
jgi:hypothetical protein